MYITLGMYNESERVMVSWAAPMLTKAGCTLHPIPDGWDVELPDGSWRAANGARELVQVANEVTRDARAGR